MHCWSLIGTWLQPALWNSRCSDILNYLKMVRWAFSFWSISSPFQYFRSKLRVTQPCRLKTESNTTAPGTPTILWAFYFAWQGADSTTKTIRFILPHGCSTFSLWTSCFMGCSHRLWHFFGMVNFSLVGFGFPGELFGSYTLHDQARRVVGRLWMEPPIRHGGRRPRTLGPLSRATCMRRKPATECPWHGLVLCSLLLRDRLW